MFRLVGKGGVGPAQVQGPIFTLNPCCQLPSVNGASDCSCEGGEGGGGDVQMASEGLTAVSGSCCPGMIKPSSILSG